MNNQPSFFISAKKNKPKHKKKVKMSRRLLNFLSKCEDHYLLFLKIIKN